MASVADTHEGTDNIADPSRKPAFKATRLTQSTFVIKEYADVYDEQPLIYAKVCAEINTIVIMDTGCGGKTEDPDIDLTSLRAFIETIAIPDNGNKPLNKGGHMKYVVVLSHCHYDHIRELAFSPSTPKYNTHCDGLYTVAVGVEQFAKDSPILASDHNPSFLDPARLPDHTLCKVFGIPVPSYEPQLVPHQHKILSDQAGPGGTRPWTGLTIIHTPGHTPDHIALWDENERMIYVGDTLYEWSPIIFTGQGSIVDWLKSVDKLLETIGSDEAQVSSGHVTAGKPAQDVIKSTKAFMMDVLSGKEQVKRREEKAGEEFVHYIQKGHHYSLACPERLVREAQEAVMGSK